MIKWNEEELHEECGVFGMFDLNGNDVASTIYYGLFALQHRGQESCGISGSDTNGPMRNSCTHKGMGLCNEVFTMEELKKLKGNIGVGHVRYSTAGSSTRENAQPLVLNYVKGTLSLAHNGNLGDRSLYHCAQWDEDLSPIIPLYAMGRRPVPENTIVCNTKGPNIL